MLIKKFLICDYPITKILFSESYFILGGESQNIYVWQYDKEIGKNNFMNTLEQHQPDILSFDSSINSISISPFNDESIISTQNSLISLATLK